MQLQLSDLDFRLDDNADVDVPNYVKRIDPGALDRTVDMSKLIVAAGTDERDHKMTLITGDGRILVFDTIKYYIPPGPSMPCDGGKQIFFKNISGRWPGDCPGFFADSKWIIEKSESALKGATLQVNYPYENNSK